MFSMTCYAVYEWKSIENRRLGPLYGLSVIIINNMDEKVMKTEIQQFKRLH